MPKTAKKREHSPINWKKVLRVATAKKANGEPKYSITAMAKLCGHYNEKSPDPNQEFRGMLSRFRTKGVMIDGKLVKLAKSTVRRGHGAVAVKKAAPAKAKVKTKVTAKAPKNAVLIQLHDSKRVIRVEVGKKEALVPVAKAMPMVENLAHGLGYKLVKDEEQVQAPQTEAVEKAVETEENQPHVPTVTVEATAPVATEDTQAA